jgi:SAM-dependent methyltransferase
MSLKGRPAAEILRFYEELVETDPGSVGYSEESLKDVLVRVVSNLPGDELVELGCGPNPIVPIELALRGKRVAAVDLSRDFVENARVQSAVRDASIRFECASAHETPFADSSFDIAILSEVLEHVPDELEESVLREVHRILRVNGLLVISVPNRRSIFHRWQRLRTGVAEEHPEHLRDYDPSGVRALLERCGFRVERQLRIPATVRPFRQARSAWLLDRLIPLASLSLKAAFVARAT